MEIVHKNKVTLPFYNEKSVIRGYLSFSAKTAENGVIKSQGEGMMFSFRLDILARISEAEKTHQY